MSLYYQDDVNFKLEAPFPAEGVVKWFNSDKGYGFITTDDGHDVFLHFSELQMEGFKNVEEGQKVRLTVALGTNGKAQAHRVHVVDALDDEPVDSETDADLTDWIGVALVNGRLRLISVSPDGQAVLLDPISDPTTILVLSPTRLALMDAIDELESLMNEGAPESAFQAFFESHEDFIVPEEYVRARPQITLARQDEPDLRPDFMLEPHNQQQLADILELKLPTAPVVVGKSGGERFSAAVSAACAQLREYREYFESSRQRQWFEQKYSPLRAFRPSLWLVIGRRGEIDPFVFRRLEHDLPAVKIRTYDALVERAKAKLSRMS